MGAQIIPPQLVINGDIKSLFLKNHCIVDLIFHHRDDLSGKINLRFQSVFEN
jgi:hypothetical protein